jgi:hypothetical protein
MHVVFLCLESNKYFFTILIAFVLGLTSQLEIIIVLSFALPDRHLTSVIKISLYYNRMLSTDSTRSYLSRSDAYLKTKRDI